MNVLLVTMRDLLGIHYHTKRTLDLYGLCKHKQYIDGNCCDRGGCTNEALIKNALLITVCGYRTHHNELQV